MQASDQLLAPAALPSGKNRVPIAFEAGRAPETVWTLWRREKALAPAGIRTMDSPAISESLH